MKQPKGRIPMSQVLRLRRGGRHPDQKKVESKKQARGRSASQDGW